MGDLYLGCCILAALSAALVVLTWRVTHQLPDRTCDLLAGLVVVALFLYIQEVWYHARLADWLPYSNLVIIGNWLPLLAAVLGTLAWRRTVGSPVRRAFSVSALGLTAGFALIFPVLGSPPKCGDRWDNLGTCVQTTRHTCSPACAATLLRIYGIPSTEQEMAELCLTREGTSWQGLYRGLKLKTAGTAWDVQVCQCSAPMLRRFADSPLILSVGLESNSGVDPEFSREFGWEPGVNHSVILQEFDSRGTAVIIDPAEELCREKWDTDTFRILWRGYAMRLVPRYDFAHTRESEMPISLASRSK